MDVFTFQIRAVIRSRTSMDVFFSCQTAKLMLPSKQDFESLEGTSTCLNNPNAEL